MLLAVTPEIPVPNHKFTVSSFDARELVLPMNIRQRITKAPRRHEKLDGLHPWLLVPGNSGDVPSGHS